MHAARSSQPRRVEGLPPATDGAARVARSPGALGKPPAPARARRLSLWLCRTTPPAGPTDDPQLSACRSCRGPQRSVPPWCSSAPRPYLAYPAVCLDLTGHSAAAPLPYGDLWLLADGVGAPPVAALFTLASCGVWCHMAGASCPTINGSEISPGLPRLGAAVMAVGRPGSAVGCRTCPLRAGRELASRASLPCVAAQLSMLYVPLRGALLPCRRRVRAGRGTAPGRGRLPGQPRRVVGQGGASCAMKRGPRGEGTPFLRRIKHFRVGVVCLPHTLAARPSAHRRAGLPPNLFPCG